MIHRGVFVTTTLEGWHRWPNASRRRDYLEGLHRHLFHVRVEIGVSGSDREIEFHDLLEDVKSILDTFPLRKESCSSLSCEQLAEKLISRLSTSPLYTRQVIKVDFSEDGENGAVVLYTPSGPQELINAKAD